MGIKVLKHKMNFLSIKLGFKETSTKENQSTEDKFFINLQLRFFFYSLHPYIKETKALKLEVLKTGN